MVLFKRKHSSLPLLLALIACLSLCSCASDSFLTVSVTTPNLTIVIEGAPPALAVLQQASNLNSLALPVSIQSGDYPVGNLICTIKVGEVLGTTYKATFYSTSTALTCQAARSFLPQIFP